MVAAQEAHAWPKPCPCGRCWAPHFGQTLTGVCSKSAVTKLVYFELCLLHSSCFVFQINFFFFFFLLPQAGLLIENG